MTPVLGFLFLSICQSFIVRPQQVTMFLFQLTIYALKLQVVSFYRVKRWLE